MAKRKPDQTADIESLWRAHEAGDTAASQTLHHRIKDAISRADAGDEGAAAEVRRFLQVVPDRAGWAEGMGGDLAALAEDSLVKAITGEKLAMREALRVKLDALRRDLAGPSPTPLEQLLVERVVTCWLQAAHADALVVQAEQTEPGEPFSIELGNYHQRRQERAHRRLLSAAKMLATVRRLLQPIKVDVKLAGSIETRTAAEPVTARAWTLPAATRN